jgi:hypothetical protein
MNIVEVLNSTAAANLVIGTVLPLIVALVTAKVASQRVKAVVLLTLSLVSAGIVEALSDGSFAWSEVFAQFIVVWPTAILTHYGFLKPVGISGTEGVIQNTVPGGIGGTKSPDDGDGGDGAEVVVEDVEEPLTDVDDSYFNVSANDQEGSV